MPHTSSAIDRAARLRRSYTGEVHQLALRALREHGSRQIVPNTTSIQQRKLETALLLAIRDAQSTFSDYVPHTGHQVFRMVSPRPNGLMVELFDDVVVRFIRALIPPADKSDSTYGVPGLRIVLTRQWLRVHLLDEHGRLTDARVDIRNVTSLDWEHIWQQAQAIEHGGGGVDLLLKHSPSLSPGEQDMLGCYWQVRGPIALGSAMLRRAGLLLGAFEVDTWTGNGGCYLHVESYRGPSVHEILTALRHPLAGVTRGQFIVDTTLGPVDENTTYARIIDTAPDPATFLGESHHSRPGLVLRGSRGSAGGA